MARSGRWPPGRAADRTTRARVRRWRCRRCAARRDRVHRSAAAAAPSRSSTSDCCARSMTKTRPWRSAAIALGCINSPRPRVASTRPSRDTLCTDAARRSSTNNADSVAASPSTPLTRAPPSACGDSFSTMPDAPRCSDHCAPRPSATSSVAPPSARASATGDGSSVGTRKVCTRRPSRAKRSTWRVAGSSTHADRSGPSASAVFGSTGAPAMPMAWFIAESMRHKRALPASATSRSWPRNAIAAGDSNLTNMPLPGRGSTPGACGGVRKPPLTTRHGVNGPIARGAAVGEPGSLAQPNIVSAAAPHRLRRFTTAPAPKSAHRLECRPACPASPSGRGRSGPRPRRCVRCGRCRRTCRR